MFRYYYLENGRAYENDSFIDDGIVNVIDPSENELKQLSEQFGINAGKLQAATDVDEPSMWERDGNCTYLIIDIPYVDDNGNYDTVSMMVINCDKALVILCEKDTHIIERFLNRYSRFLESDDRLGIQIRLIFAITKEYQQDLKDIDSVRRDVEKNLRNKLDSEDVATLHELENSLVYFITSLKGFNSVLELIRRDREVEIDVDTNALFHTARIENKQSIEMATVYKEIVSNTRELLSTEINLKMNRTMQILAVFTVLLTVPMVVTGAYGMNVDLPLQEDHFVFDVIFWFTACIVGGLLICFRKKHIL